MWQIFISFLLLFTLSCSSDKTTQTITDSDENIVNEDSVKHDEDCDVVMPDKDENADETSDITLDETPDEDTVDPCEGFVAVDCDESVSICTAYNVVEACVKSECGKSLVETECPASHGCFDGKCVANLCADECIPGEEKDGKICEYWDNTKTEWTTTDQTAVLYDRFEEFQRWQHKDLMPFGGVADARYETEDHKKLLFYDGVGDSAIWTGTYLAAESIRYMVDGSVAARENIKNMVETLHLFFNVAGSPGLLARYAYESQQRHTETGDALQYSLNCEDDKVFCDIPYDGKMYDYKGHISRDQYQGILMGYSLAYDALKGVDEKTRAIIRDDIVEFVNEIMKKRTLAVRFSYDNLPPGGVNMKDIEFRFSIIAPREMVDGDILISYCSTEDANCSSTMHGFQEFMPNIGVLLHQLNGNLPDDIERPGSGMMLANIFNIGMQVTENIPGYETQFNSFQTFYYTNDDQWGNITDWIEQMARYKYSFECGEKYYGININMEPMFNLLRLEKNEAIRTAIYERVLKEKLWETVKTDKNVFFSYIYASQGASDPNIAIAATEQLRGFPIAPHVYYPVNLLDDPKYTLRAEKCTNQVDHSISVDVADRKAADFIWQRNPFELLIPGDSKKTFSGVDYMIVYWMGRKYGYLQDDSNGKCFRWK